MADSISSAACPISQREQLSGGMKSPHDSTGYGGRVFYSSGNINPSYLVETIIQNVEAFADYYI